MEKVERYYDAVSKDYHQIYDVERGLSYKNGVQDYFRLQIVLRILARAGAKSVFEVGVGDGTPLRSMHRMGLRVAGCDISPKMVELAKQRMKEAGVAEPSIWQADVCNAVELATPMMSEPADALVALGVMPHVEKDLLALKNMRTLVRTGGRLLVEFRNSLFSLFTFNRYTHDFIVDDLLVHASETTRAVVSERLKHHLRMDLPPVRDKLAEGNGPGFDLIRAKFHNPLEIAPLLARAGFSDVTFHWYHYHAAMPMLQDELGECFDAEAIAMEHERPDDWRGMFLCSAVLVEANAK